MLKISVGTIYRDKCVEYLVTCSDFILERKIQLEWYDKKGGKGDAMTGKVPVWCIRTYTISDSGYIYINCTHMHKFPLHSACIYIHHLHHRIYLCVLTHS